MWELVVVVVVVGGDGGHKYFKNTPDFHCHYHYSGSPFTVPSSPRRIHDCLCV